jgi:CelD/BcsL family acetyltransferase involved in cellulose biosynthesis
LEVIETSFENEALRDWWHNAYNDNELSLDTVFQSLSWQEAWWKQYGRVDKKRKLFLLEVKEAGGTVGIVPFVLQTRLAAGMKAWNHFTWLGHDAFPYQSPICARSHQDRVMQEAISYCFDRVHDAWFELHDIGDDETWPDLVAASGAYRVERVPAVSRKYLDIARFSLDDAAGSYSTRLQRSLQRSRRRMNFPGEEFVFSVEIGNNERWLKALFELGEKRFNEDSFLAEETNRRFVRDVVLRLEGETRYCVLKRGREVAHIILGFLHGGTFFFYLSAMDPSLSDFFPGFTNLHNAVLYAIKHGAHKFDFMRGTDPYKSEFNPITQTASNLTMVPRKNILRYKTACAFRHMRERKSQ